MGFWHTGYIEFHQEHGLGDSYTISPPVYHCSTCQEPFPTLAQLREHRFQSHPYTRPMLFVRDVEVGGTPIKITKPLAEGDLQFEGYTGALLNGKTVTKSELEEGLAKLRKDTATIELQGDHVKSVFTLRFEIAEEEDLQGVSRCFQEVAHGRRLDKRAIDDFIKASRRYDTAIGYCDGIADYFYGVLLKERSEETTLPFDAYRDKFTRAADQLKTYDQPLARMIGGVIAFHFNHFNEVLSLAGQTRLGIVSKRFVHWLEGTDDPIPEHELDHGQTGASLEPLITDMETEQILRWSVAGWKKWASNMGEMEVFSRQNLPGYDRAKLHIMLAQFSLQNGNKDQALRYAKEYRNNPSLSVWAEHIVEACHKLQ